MSSWLKDDVLGEDTLELILENITRWEGLFLALQRLLKLKDKLKGNKTLQQYFSDVKSKVIVAEDILLKSFFERLEGHYRLLKVFHDVSVLSQNEKQCSIAWIPSWIMVHGYGKSRRHVEHLGRPLERSSSKQWTCALFRSICLQHHLR